MNGIEQHVFFMSRLVRCVVVATTCAVASYASAATIGVNITNTDGSLDVAAADYAGVAPSQNWNNVDRGNSGGATNLINNKGFVTTADFAYVSGFSTASAVSVAGPNGNMMSSGVNIGGVTDSFTITNLPGLNAGRQYELYVYFNSSFGATDPQNRRWEHSVTQGGSTTPSVFAENLDGGFTGAFVQATATTDTVGAQANYVHFARLTGADMTLNISNINGGDSVVSGFQVVEVLPGDVISVNFMRGSSTAFTQLASSEVAGAVAEDNWNNIDIDTSRSFGATALVNSDGGATTATIASTVSPGFDANNGNGNSTSDHKMMNGSLYFDNGDATDTGNLTISGLSGDFVENGYSVYVYFETDTTLGNREHTITINSVDVTGLDDGTFLGQGGTYNQALGTGVSANFAYFTGLTDSSFTIDLTSTNGRGGIAGIQIVANGSIPAPEPSTLALAALGLLGLTLRRRRQ